MEYVSRDWVELSPLSSLSGFVSFVGFPSDLDDLSGLYRLDHGKGTKGKQNFGRSFLGEDKSPFRLFSC